MKLYFHQLRSEQRLFWRSRELAFFTFLLPIVFLLLFGSAYGDEEIDGISGYEYLLAGMLGYGAAATSSGLAIILVIRREAGTLKRLRATPLPPLTYVAALLSSMVLVFLLEAAILVAISRIAFDVPVPERLVSLVLAVLLGAIAFAAIAVAIAGLITSAEGASPVINAIYLPLTFISGAFFGAESFPSVLQTVAEVLPLKHFIELVRDIVIGGDEVWGDLGGIAVIVAWGVAGALVAARRFRWEPQSQ